MTNASTVPSPSDDGPITAQMPRFPASPTAKILKGMEQAAPIEHQWVYTSLYCAAAAALSTIATAVFRWPAGLGLFVTILAIIGTLGHQVGMHSEMDTRENPTYDIYVDNDCGLPEHVVRRVISSVHKPKQREDGVWVDEWHIRTISRRWSKLVLYTWVEITMVPAAFCLGLSAGIANAMPVFVVVLLTLVGVLLALVGFVLIQLWLNSFIEVTNLNIHLTRAYPARLWFLGCKKIPFGLSAVKGAEEDSKVVGRLFRHVRVNVRTLLEDSEDKPLKDMRFIPVEARFADAINVTVF